MSANEPPTTVAALLAKASVAAARIEKHRAAMAQVAEEAAAARGQTPKEGVTK